MGASCFADVLNTHVALTANEMAALARLEERPRVVRRNAMLHRENEAGGELYILRHGMMMSYILLHDGSRQILRFLFPGDVIGLPGVIYRKAPETIAALTESTVCPFDRAALSRLFVEHPRLAALVTVLGQVEQVSLSDRLASLGRTSARARVAALLLDLRNRLRAGDRTIGDPFLPGLTQEEMGDALGLTAVHVNRMLRQLEQDGLIAREMGRVSVLDERGLTRTANYVDRHGKLELGWLPEGR